MLLICVSPTTTGCGREAEIVIGDTLADADADADADAELVYMIERCCSACRGDDGLLLIDNAGIGVLDGRG